MKKQIGLPLVVAAALVSNLHSATFTVVNTNNSGAGSLRQAILDANSNAGADTIAFAITNASLTISPTNALPNLIEAVTIDGTTQSGFSNHPIVELSGAVAGSPQVNGLRVSAGGCVIRGLAITRFSGDGIAITNGVASSVTGCYLGVAPDGVTKRGNNGAGVHIGGYNFISYFTTQSNVIGGESAALRNLISGNLYGVQIEYSSNNIVLGNRIGTDADGLFSIGNTNAGVFVYGENSVYNSIGGTNSGEGNLISGNGVTYNGGEGNAYYYADGVLLAFCSSNAVAGNLIGTDVTGTNALANTQHGVNITSSSSANCIGAGIPGARNVISGNLANGVNIANSGGEAIAAFPFGSAILPEGNTVQGNLIGTDS